MLQEPQFRTSGEHTFVVGRVPGGELTLWVPLNDVTLIEEFKDVEALGKMYRVHEGKK